MNGIVINARREGYGIDQCGGTLTVSELISHLSGFDPDTPVFVGNDYQGSSLGWYTYGPVKGYDIREWDQDDDDDEEEEE